MNDSAHLVLNPRPEGHYVKEKNSWRSISRRNMLAAAAAGGFLTAANAAATQTSAESKEDQMGNIRKETDSLGVVEVPADKLWGAQTQRSLEHFSIGKDLIPREMITAYAILKKAAAITNHASKRLDDQRYKLIVQTCDEILAGQHHDMFPLHVWMTGSGTQFNMNVNEVISNRCCQLAGTPLGSKRRSIPTITSTWRSRQTIHFRRPCISRQPSM